MKRFFTSLLLTAALAASAQAPGTVIYDQPEGDAVDYDMHYSGFYLNRDQIDYVDDNVLTTTLVMGEDGYLYIKNIFAFMPTDTWVKAEVTDDNRVELQLPQTIYYENDEDYGESWLDLNIFYPESPEESIPEAVSDPTINRLVFNIADDGSLVLNPLGEGYSLSCISQPDNMWMAFSITDITYSEAAEPGLVTPPQGMTGKKYSYITWGMGNKESDPKDFGYRMEFIFDGTDVYIGGMSLDMPDAWVKGRLEGEKIIIPGNQPMGNYGGIFDVFLQYCKADADALGGYSLLPSSTEYTFVIDDKAGTIKPGDPDVIIIINAPDDKHPIRFLQMLDDPELLYQPEPKGTPMPAWKMRWLERIKGENFDLLDFNLPMISTDGVLLDRKNMYYRLYMDGDHYEILDEDFDSGVDMWDIPYDFNRYLIVCNRMNTAHEMGIRVSGYDSLGIQSVNVYDGVEYESEIVTVYVDGSSSGIIEAAGPDVESEQLFDLNGRAVTGEAAGGIFIRRSIMSDGSVRHSKVMISK